MEAAGDPPTGLEAVRAVVENIVRQTNRHRSLIRNLRRWITGELNNLEDRVETLNEQLREQGRRNTFLRDQNERQAEQIASITAQVHLLTNKVDLLMEEREAVRRNQQQEEEQPGEPEDQQGNLVQE